MRSAIDKLLPIARVAKRLSVSRSVVRQWAGAGLFPSPVELPGGEMRWRESEVAGWISGLRPSEGRTEGRRGTDRGTEGDGGGRTAELSELAAEILQALGEQSGWILGAELARSVSPDADHTSGHWRKTLGVLRAEGLIESSKANGYRLTEKGRTWDGPGTE